MRIVAIDFETYFDSDYSLSKLSTEAYVRDPRFEVHGAAIKWGNDYRARWYDARQLKQVLADEDWSDTAILAHHAQFDGLILSHHFAVRPRLWLDTLSMARLQLGNHLSVSLDSVRSHYGMAAKRTPYERFKGKHWRELDEYTQTLINNGCCDEVESIWNIFLLLTKTFPDEEYSVVDLTIRMFTEPVLKADLPLLGSIWEAEEGAKYASLAALDVSAADLGSNQSFSALLLAAGVEEIATKQGKRGPIPCFAKTDEFMRELVEDESPRIAGLARARLGIKSSITQTRAATLGAMAQRGPLAVYLRYCGAHTTRWSGGDNTNFQNLKRSGDLRRTILAPPGSLLATVDLSQIECRLLNYLAGQDDVTGRFASGADPYVGIASQFYGRDITKADAAERGTGKQAELSCGYGCGWKRFKAVAKLGSYGPAVNLADSEAQRFVEIYRRTHERVVGYWRHAEKLIPDLASGAATSWGPMQIRDQRIYLPNGTALIYETLSQDPEGGEGWYLQTRAGWTRMYGAKLVENVIQALARVVMSQAAVRIVKAGFKPVLSSHDEWSFIVADDNKANDALEFIKREMVRVPDWLPGIPLDCEGGLNPRYSK